MDDYQEYSRMAKLMTKIHAQPADKEEEVNENENIVCTTISQKPKKEENKEKFVSDIKFQYKQATNLDVSMEEEDKVKEPLQNYSSMMNSNINNPEGFGSKEEENNVFGTKPNRISGASLFGAKAETGIKKPKNKKKKVRRI